MEINHRLVEKILDEVDFEKIHQIYQLYRCGNTKYYDDIMISASYCWEDSTRILSAKSLRNDSRMLLEHLFNDDFYEGQEIIDRNMSHGGFTAEVTSEINGVIDSISLSFVPIISECSISEL